MCYLLLLSYTSVATTSLILLRSLTFDNVDKIYTYLSADMEYFHGHHLPYAIVAIFCTIVIVIVTATGAIPYQQDQFYKDETISGVVSRILQRQASLVAAYYMICRLVIIVIIIATPTNNDTTQILPTIATTVLALIHLVLRPYASEVLME